MNIFVLSTDPHDAAIAQCDKHIPKMCVETAQMLASACRRHGYGDDDMPLTQSGRPYKGGYRHHPCTLWAGQSRENFEWLYSHGMELCREYTLRYDATHACRGPIQHMSHLAAALPRVGLTAFAQAMPDEYRDDNPVVAYRNYYTSKSFASWQRGREAPAWWPLVNQSR